MSIPPELVAIILEVLKGLVILFAGALESMIRPGVGRAYGWLASRPRPSLAGRGGAA